MKYAVIAVVNGTFTVKAESDDVDSIIVSFHSVCTTLWNSADVQKATVVIANEKMGFTKVEYIHYDDQV